MIRGHLKLLVLKFLNKKPMSGYTLMDNIEEMTGSRPSPGSIYPLLDNLSNEKLVSDKKEGKTKIYSLTKKGNLKVQQLKKKKKEIVDKVSGLMQILGNVCDKHESKFFMQMFEHMKTGKIPFVHLEPEITELRNIIAEKASKKNINTKKTKQILKKAAKQIKEM